MDISNELQMSRKRKLGEIINISSGSRKRKCVKKKQNDAIQPHFASPMME